MRNLLYTILPLFALCLLFIPTSRALANICTTSIPFPFVHLVLFILFSLYILRTLKNRHSGIIFTTLSCAVLVITLQYLNLTFSFFHPHQTDAIPLYNIFYTITLFFLPLSILSWFLILALIPLYYLIYRRITNMWHKELLSHKLASLRLFLIVLTPALVIFLETQFFTSCSHMEIINPPILPALQE